MTKFTIANGTQQNHDIQTTVGAAMPMTIKPGEIGTVEIADDALVVKAFADHLKAYGMTEEQDAQFKPGRMSFHVEAKPPESSPQQEESKQ